MAHECFENRDIAALMNDLFVNIKVDREERPDLDTIYQYALALLGEQGGWPLTMFLTPAGEPFWGGTYFPPEARWGRPGFPDVLRALSNAYKSERDKVAKSAAALKQGLARLSTPQGGAGLSIDATDRIAARLLQEVDPEQWRHRRRAEIPAARPVRAAVARFPPHAARAAAPRRRPDARRTSRKAASTIMSAAAIRATRRTRVGSCRISRKCSTTMRSSSIC